jgi:hypothetical protein
MAIGRHPRILGIMKSLLTLLVILLVCPACFASVQASKEDFLAAVRAAFEAKDIKRIHELTWEKGVSDYDRQMFDEGMPMTLKNTAGVGSITFEPLAATFIPQAVAMGRRFEATYPPTGMLKIDLKSTIPNASAAAEVPYAVIDGGYYLVGQKTTDLGWKGPQDRFFTVSALGNGQDKVKVHIKFNASGVDLESDGSRGFPCQYISEVAVTSVDDDVDVTLRIADGMKTIYESKPLKGKGQIVYKKGDQAGK